MQNPMQLESTLRQMPDQYLMQEMQRPSGRVPQFLVMSELQRRKKLRQSARGAQADGNPTTVAEDTMQGIAALPAENMGNIPEEGVIGMAEGGFLPFGGFGQDSGQRESFVNRALREREERRRRIREMQEALATRSAIDGDPMPTPKEEKPGILDGIWNPNISMSDEDMRNLVRARGDTAIPGIVETLTDPETYRGGPDITFPKQTGRNIYVEHGEPWGALFKRGLDFLGSKTNIPGLGDAQAEAGAPEGVAPAADGEHLGTPEDPIPVPAIPEGTTPAAPGAPPPPAAGAGAGDPAGSISASGLVSLTGGAGGNPYEPVEINRDDLIPGDLSAEEALRQQQGVRALVGVEGEPGQKVMEYLDRHAKELEGRKGSRMGNALMQAGLAMMAGESPYFFTNVGRGLQQGVESYRDEGREIDKTERENLRLAAEVEAAQRAEKIGMADSALGAQRQREAEQLVGKREYTKLDAQSKMAAQALAAALDRTKLQASAALRAAQVRAQASGKDVSLEFAKMGLAVIQRFGDEYRKLITDGAFKGDPTEITAKMEAQVRKELEIYLEHMARAGIDVEKTIASTFTPVGPDDYQ